jgi:hypothetical protein
VGPAHGAEMLLAGIRTIHARHPISPSTNSSPRFSRRAAPDSRELLPTGSLNPQLSALDTPVSCRNATESSP